MPKGEKWGSKLATALTLPCEERPVPGRPVVVGHGGIVSSQHGVTGSGIADGAVGSDHLDRGMRDLIFGGGYDGEADFDGTSTVHGVAPSSSIYTLSKELSISRMHVRAGVTIKPTGYRIFARELHLWGSAIIQRDGAAGTDPSGATGGTKGAGAGTANMLGGSAPGGNGGDGGALNSAGTGGENGSAIGNYSLGGNGGDGGGGTASVGAAGAKGTGGSVSTVADVSIYSLENITRLVRSSNGSFLPINGGAGGGGGGGGGGSAIATGGGAGGAGAGGGVLLVCADEIVLHDWTGRISANGGNGGLGNAVASAGDGGGGGAGGGGLAMVVCRKITGGSLVTSPTSRGTGGGSLAIRTFAENSTNVSGANIQANGGDGGALDEAGSSGVGLAGGGGTAVVVCLGRPFVPAPELPTFFRAAPPARAPHLHPGHYAAMNLSQQFD